jgi:hypothetical protein
MGRLSQWGRRGVFYSFKWFLPVFASLRGGGGGSAPCGNKLFQEDFWKDFFKLVSGFKETTLKLYCSPQKAAEKVGDYQCYVHKESNAYICLDPSKIFISWHYSFLTIRSFSMHNLKLFASLSFPVMSRERPAVVCQEFAHFLCKVLKTNFYFRPPL